VEGEGRLAGAEAAEGAGGDSPFSSFVGLEKNEHKR